jgi:hypothetical protein
MINEKGEMHIYEFLSIFNDAFSIEYVDET